MKNKPFFKLAVGIAASWVIILSCSIGSSFGNTATPGGFPGNDIIIRGMEFSPASITVVRGTIVKWTNKDNYAYRVISNDGTSFDSGNIGGTATYSYMTTTVGTFDYHCTIHGKTMSGTLIVTP